MKNELTKEAIEYVCNHTHHFKDTDRTRAICEMRLQGYLYKDIGKEFNLSPSRCEEICNRVARIYASAVRLGKIHQEVIWRWEYGLCMPFCPYCDGPAYEEDHCVFCLRKYKYTESPVKDTRVTVGEYTVIQLSNNALYVYKGERCVMHASSAKKMTEDELREMVAHYKELSSTVKPCDMCAYYDTDRKDQPCCSCNGQNFEVADNEQRKKANGC